MYTSIEKDGKLLNREAVALFRVVAIKLPEVLLQLLVIMEVTTPDDIVVNAFRFVRLLLDTTRFKCFYNALAF